MKVTRSRLAALALMGSILSTPILADENNIPAVFRGETQGSPVEIRYDDWNAILKLTVVDAGMSDRTSSSAPRATLGTRTVRGNTSSTRNEGNRIAFPAFADYDGNLAVLEKIKTELMAVPDEAPMQLWTKNEQLAYWLNLYNLTVVIELSKEYPVRSLKSMRKSSRSDPGLWDRKLMKVAGVDLSLNDVHDILVEKWDSSLVMYGLFQGYVGGPSIQDRAYTGKNVHKMLVENAREFVNSNRGMRFRGSTLQISEYYKENEALFPNWEDDLKSHFVSLTDYGMHGRIKSASKIKATTDDFYIADLFGGTTRTGTASQANPAALTTARIGANEGAESLGLDINFGIGDWDMASFADYQLAPIDTRFPEYTTEFIQQMRKNKALRPGHVDVEEVDQPKEKKEDGK
ncbi:DUF547 domain-containing protein [Kordiimonas gwangyangensis]|uniref:DUF547 domain-containing protein n=1 Tax=Kordiimonas gwangyangensis TaxID=288022 RepID=UPI00036DEFA8|nr:DUF547 domain-containing protein [Kordiimonas gwangyangensis]